MADFRFARSPRWIAGHLLVLVLVAAMVAAGFWQLARLDERRARNVLVESQAALPPEDVGALVDPGASEGDLDLLRFRAVSAAGEYDAGATVAVRATQDGAPGANVLSVLELDTGEAVVVLRGFGGGPDVSDPEPPPGGAVDVQGLAVPIARLDRPTRIAVEGLEVPGDRLLPVVVQRTGATPLERLLPLPEPELDEGPHLGYAVQWFLFAGVAVVGYPLLLRRRSRERQEA